MKKDIHPKYYENAVIECSCGNRFEAGSTKEHIQVEICSACHPFYTGKHKLVDTAGRVDKFREKMEKADKAKLEKEIRDKKKKAKLAENKQAEKKEIKKKEQKSVLTSDLAQYSNQDKPGKK